MTNKVAINEIISILKQCQQFDKDIYQFNEQIRLIPHKIASLKKSFESEKENLHKLEAHLKEKRMQLKNTEVDLQSKEEQIKKYEGQLTLVKTNKEYAALQGEINELKKECSEAEERVIIDLDEISELEKEVSIEKGRLDEKTKELNEKIAALESEKKKDEQKVEENKQGRSKILEPLDPKVTSLYDQIVLNRNGNALSEITGEICSECRVRIRPQIINEVQLAEELVQCESCSRILFLS